MDGPVAEEVSQQELLFTQPGVWPELIRKSAVFDAVRAMDTLFPNSYETWLLRLYFAHDMPEGYDDD